MSERFDGFDESTERISASEGDVGRILARMRHDLETAEKLSTEAPDWSLAAAHQAIYGACVALMAAHGYRPKVNGHHKTAIAFARVVLGDQKELLDQADMIRRRRHRLMYGTSYVVSQDEVAAALTLARKVAEIATAVASAEVRKRKT